MKRLRPFSFAARHFSSPPHPLPQPPPAHPHTPIPPPPTHQALPPTVLSGLRGRCCRSRRWHWQLNFAAVAAAERRQRPLRRLLHGRLPHQERKGRRRGPSLISPTKAGAVSPHCSHASSSLPHPASVRVHVLFAAKGPLDPPPHRGREGAASVGPR